MNKLLGQGNGKINSKAPSLLIHGTNARITIDSRKIATIFGRSHKNVLKTIDGLIEDGTISRLEYKPSNYFKRGKEYRCYELNEAGFLKAMPFIGGRKSKEGQKRLVDEFISLRNCLDKQSKERESLAFQMVRLSGKDARSLLADEIKRFIEYAKLQGSSNAKHYFSLITELTYKSLLIFETKADHIRECLTPVQLSQLQTAELMALNVLAEGMQKHLPYKQIFQHVKQTLAVFENQKSNVLEV